VQTFLPFAEFSESAESLDQARLGKQRVEALQVLRAIVLPAYGWQSHPAMQMWRGYVPALVRYSLAMVDVWTAEGRADTTRPLIAEFAPEAAGPRGVELPMPSWLGNEQFHLSHRSNLVRKFPEFYAQRFPGVPDDLPYLWPGTDAGAVPLTIAGAPLWVIRPRDADQFDDWFESGCVTLGEESPRGKRSRAWLAQLDEFAALPVDSPVAVLQGAGEQLLAGRVIDEVTAYSDEQGVGLRRRVAFGPAVPRSSFSYPALLQDPRSFFAVTGAPPEAF
jgi:hypothetical protein